MLCPQNRAARSNTRASALTAPRLVRLPPLLPLLMFPVQLIPEGGLPVYGDTPAPVMPTSKCYCVSMPTLSEPTFSDRGCASLWSRDARGAGVAPDDRGDGVASTFLLWSSSLTTFCLRPCFHDSLRFPPRLFTRRQSQSRARSRYAGYTPIWARSSPFLTAWTT
jgi:hypothetical protein